MVTVFFPVSCNRLLVIAKKLPLKSLSFLGLLTFSLLTLSACSDSERWSSEADSADLVFDPPGQGGELPRWIPLSEDGAQAEFSVVDSSRDSVGQALLVSLGDNVGKNRWNVQVFRPAISVETDVVYEYVVWVNGEAGTFVTVAIESEDYHTIKSKDVYLVGEWQPIAFEFISPYPTIRTPIHFGHPQNMGKSIVVDSVSLSLAH